MTYKGVKITKDDLQNYYENSFHYALLTDEEYEKIAQTATKNVCSDSRFKYLIEESIEIAIDDYVVANNIKRRLD